MTAAVYLALLCPPLWFKAIDPHADAANAKQRQRAQQLLDAASV